MDYFSIIYGIILPIDELIFFREIETTNQSMILLCIFEDIYMMLMGYSWDVYGIFDMFIYPLVNIQKTMERSTIFTR
jgi:hypothetical protein